MPTLPNMGLITPTLGGDSGTWDDKINAALALIDSHDHTSGKGVKVPIAGINVNANLAMGGYSVTGVFSYDFAAVSPINTGSKRLFVSNADNELYWRTNGGTNVKLTSGTSINTTLVGGIVGDYSSVGAEVAFDDANGRYTFKNGASPSKKWARLAAGPLRIFEYNTTESVYVEQLAPAALGASYTVTWPTALPASTCLVRLKADGTLDTSSNIDQDLTLAATRSISVSSTGKFKHDGRSILVPCQPALADTTAGAGATHTSGQPKAKIAVSSTVYLPLMLSLPDDALIQTITIGCDAAVGAGATFRLYEAGFGSYTYDNITVTGDGVGNAPILDCTGGGGLSVSGLKPLWVRVVTDGSTTVNIGHFEIFYTIA